jgi:SSS family solute:Na+ symporter
MFLVSKLYTTNEVHPEMDKGTDEKSWPAVNTAGAILVFLTILIYILLS